MSIVERVRVNAIIQTDQPAARSQAPAFWRMLAGAAGPAAACAALAWDRYAAPGAIQAWSYVLVFLLVVAWAAVRSYCGGDIHIPVLGVLLCSWILLQAAPLGRMASHLEPQRAIDLGKLAGFGVFPQTVSFYPYATARTFLTLTGAVGVFWLSREASQSGLPVLHAQAAAVLLLGFEEMLPAAHQYIAGPDVIAPMAGADFIRGSFANRNLLAAWLEGCYGVALGAAMTWLGGPKQMSRNAAGVCSTLAAVMFAATIACSFSRMGIAAVVCETVFFAVSQSQGRKRAAAALGAAACLGVSAVCAAGPKLLATRFAAGSWRRELAARGAIWLDATRVICRYPLFGSGAGAFAFAFRRSHAYLGDYTIDHAHNEYLEAAAELGVPVALLLGAGASAALVRRWHSARRARGPRRDIALGSLAGAFGLSLHSAVDFPLRVPSILALFGLLLGMAFAADSETLSRKPPVGQGPDRLWAGLALLAALTLAAFHIWAAPATAGGRRGLDRFNAELYYQAGRNAFVDGRLGEAKAACRRALQLCPYAAPVWQELALAAEAQGDVTGAVRWSDFALEIEPHTRRVEWVIGNLRLRLGDVNGALLLFHPLAAKTEEMRRPVWDACWKAGIPAGRILESVVGRSRASQEEYLQYLEDRKRRTIELLRAAPVVWIPASSSGH